MISIKTHSIESRFFIGPSNVLFAGVCMSALFSPEFLQAEAVKGLIPISRTRIQFRSPGCLLLAFTRHNYDLEENEDNTASLITD